jgi:hypothetical protein
VGSLVGEEEFETAAVNCLVTEYSGFSLEWDGTYVNSSLIGIVDAMFCWRSILLESM